MVKVTINGETFHARCDIISEFCLMPKDIYKSLNLWGLSEGGEGISLTNNSIILPIGVAEGVFTKILGRMVSTDYLVIECVGNGQITLGRSLLKLMGAIIDVEKGTIKFTSPPRNHHEFPKGKSKGKRGRRKASGLDASSLENTSFLLSAFLGDNPCFLFSNFSFCSVLEVVTTVMTSPYHFYFIFVPRIVSNWKKVRFGEVVVPKQIFACRCKNS
jgi:hypothetical protein